MKQLKSALLILRALCFRLFHNVDGSKHRFKIYNHVYLRAAEEVNSLPDKLEPAFASFTDLQDLLQKQYGFRMFAHTTLGAIDLPVQSIHQKKASY